VIIETPVAEGQIEAEIAKVRQALHCPSRIMVG
jgi:hypothetical protein